MLTSDDTWHIARHKHPRDLEGKNPPLAQELGICLRQGVPLLLVGLSKGQVERQRHPNPWRCWYPSLEEREYPVLIRAFY